MKHWKTLAALTLMTLAILFEWNWVWALFLTMSLIYMLYSDEINFVETIKKSESPVMYWIVLTFLAVFDVVLILGYLNVIQL